MTPKRRFVNYAVRGKLIRARVVTRHRDDTVTVEPFHFLDADGKPEGCFVGGRVRLDPSEIQAESR